MATKLTDINEAFSEWAKTRHGLSSVGHCEAFVAGIEYEQARVKELNDIKAQAALLGARMALANLRNGDYKFPCGMIVREGCRAYGCSKDEGHTDQCGTK